MRLQLALDVTDLDAAVDFYTRLFDTEPAKRKPGYANFAIDQPPLKLVLFEGASDGTINHLGVEVEESDEVTAAADRLAAVGLEPTTVAETTCCHADKVETWVHGPDGTRWEWYVKTADVESVPEHEVSAAASPVPGTGPLLPQVDGPPDGPACTLDEEELPGRVEQATRLLRHVREVDRDGTRVTVRVDPAGSEELDEFVRAESRCCSFFGFTRHDEPDEARLVVTSPADGQHLLDALQEALTPAGS